MVLATRSDVDPLCDIHRLRMEPVTLHYPGIATTSPAYRCTMSGCVRLYDWWRGYFRLDTASTDFQTVNRVPCSSNHTPKIAMYLQALSPEGMEVWRCPCVGCTCEVRRHLEDRALGNSK